MSRFAPGSQNRRRLVLLAALAGCLAAPTSAPHLYSQQPAAAAAPAAAPAAKPTYQSLPIAEAFKDARARRQAEGAKTDVLKGTAGFSIDTVRQYYVGYTLPKLTSAQNPSLANEARKEISFDIDYAQGKLSSENLAAYNKLMAQYFGTVATRNFHPAAVINSYLILGELNQQPANRGNPPVPYTAMTKPLLTGAIQAESDGAKAAALVGLKRHLMLLAPLMNDAQRQEYAAPLLEAAKASKPMDRTDAAHGWLVANYLQLLRSFDHTLKPQVLAFATDTLANEFTHPLLREEALRTLGAVDAVDAPPAKLANAGRYSLRYVKNRLESWQQLKGLSADASGSGGYGADYGKESSGYGEGYAGGGGGGYGGEAVVEPVKVNPFEKQDEQTKALRRFLHELIQVVSVGFTGNPAPASDAALTKGLIAKMPESEERDILLETLGLMQRMQTELNSETIEKASSLNQEVDKSVTQLLALIDEYPGAVDLENEPIIEDAPVVAPPADAEGVEPEGAEAAASTAAVQPAEAVAPPPQQ